MMRNRFFKKIAGTSIPDATPPIDEAAYREAHPYYAELCALSELRKHSGFGPELRSGIGGHSVLYLNGVRRVRGAGYPVLELCPPEEAPGAGVGISVNAHYRNANWAAFDGQDFLWRGALKAGERLTAESYGRTQEMARAAGMLEGVEFHEHLFRKKPHAMPELDYMYDLSIATDYALCFGRNGFRARLPLDRRRMRAAVDYLNGLNAPYRAGKRTYRWRLLNDNCVHVAHNALAAAGFWKPWPTGQLAALALFNFPVPKNTFVDVMLRANDLPLADPDVLFADPFLRDRFLETGTLPAGPGALALASPAIRENDLYDTRKLRLIFYDNPFWGPYHFRFARIFSDPRYFDMQANLRHFLPLYEAAARNAASGGAEIARRYGRYAAGMADAVRQRLAQAARRTAA